MNKEIETPALLEFHFKWIEKVGRLVDRTIESLVLVERPQYTTVILSAKEISTQAINGMD